MKVTGRALETCVGCDNCLDVCPSECFSSFAPILNNSELDDFSECSGCGDCLEMCPIEVINCEEE
jgi:NAD-dependent dihydropyrimidine dehydrogenase PreA subunit